MKKALVLVLAAIMVVGVAGAAFAGSQTYNNVSPATSVNGGPVNISAKVNPKITLTVATTQGGGTTLLLDWDSIDPDNTPTAKTVTLTVSSNKDYGITASESFANLTAANIAVSRTLNSTTGTKGALKIHTDTVNLAPVATKTWWDVEPGTYTGSITYTVTQNS
jgi:hypothetical protein